MWDDVWDSEENFQSLVEKSPDSILVVEDGPKIIGSVVISHHGRKVGFIYRLWIDEDYRGKGIASKLLEKVYDVLRKRGAQEATLFASSRNKKLQRFYLTRGYEIGKDEFGFMWKKL